MGHEIDISPLPGPAISISEKIGAARAFAACSLGDREKRHATMAWGFVL